MAKNTSYLFIQDNKNSPYKKAETNLPSQDQCDPNTSTLGAKPTLDQLLKKLDLDKQTLTSRALKIWSLKNHPDKNKGNPASAAKFKELTPLVEVLRIFLSATELSKYHKDADFQTNVSDLLNQSNFSNEDLIFLLSKSTSVLQKTTDTALRDDKDVVKQNFYMACAKMSKLLHEAYENKSLSFEEAINLASRTASLMAEPSEHTAFLAGTKNYKNLMNGKLWAQILVIVGTVIEWLGITKNSAWKIQGQIKLDQINTVESLANAAAATQALPKHKPDGFFSRKAPVKLSKAEEITPNLSNNNNQLAI